VPHCQQEKGTYERKFNQKLTMYIWSLTSPQIQCYPYISHLLRVGAKWVTCHLHLVLIWLAILLLYTQSVQFTIQFIKMQSSSSMFSSSHSSKCIVREKLVDDGLHKIERKWMHISLLNPPKMITWLKVTISRCELLYFLTACTQHIKSTNRDHSSLNHWHRHKKSIVQKTA
jgi:hypothetical protein